MFQEVMTQNRTHAYSIIVLFPIRVYEYALFKDELFVVFSQRIVRCYSYAKITFQKQHHSF